MRDIAADLLAEEGIGSQELGYFFGVLIDHVRVKLPSGASPATAEAEDLRRATRMRTRLLHSFKETPGLVASIVKYKSGGDHPSQ